MEKAARIIRTIIAIAAAATAAALLFTRLSGLTCTLLGAVVLAYLLGKPLKRMEKRIKRGWALLIIFGILVGAVFVFFYYVIPLFFRQAVDLLGYVPQVLQSVSSLLKQAGQNTGEPMGSIISGASDGFNRRAAEWLGNATISLAQGSYSGIGWALLLPVFTFYFLKDREYFIDQFCYLIPVRFRDDLNMLYASIDKALGQFLRGQLVVAISVAVMTTAGLLLIGVPVAPLLGLICGLSNMIPFVGPFIGAIPVAIVAASLGWRTMLFAVLTVFVVQQVDNTVISPKILGDSLRIHPAYIIAAIIAGSGLFGVIGLMFSLPMLIVLKEIVLFAFRRRLYGRAPAGQGGPNGPARADGPENPQH